MTAHDTKREQSSQKACTTEHAWKMCHTGEIAVEPDLCLLKWNTVNQLMTIDSCAPACRKRWSHDGDDAVG